MSGIVLDASAVLAFLVGEPGATEVARHIPGATISTVNLSEVVSRLAEVGAEAAAYRRQIESLGLQIVPFDEEAAYGAASLRRPTRAAGLSLGDRACLALAQTLHLPALTADRAWTRLDIGVEIQLIR